MGQFEPTTVADWIGFLLVVGVALWGGWRILIHRLDNMPFMDEDEPRYPVHAQQNMADLIAGMQSLRTPLPQHRNQTAPADDWEELLALHGVCAEDRADLLKGESFTMKISITTYRWGAWFRINGYGLSFQLGGYMSFSERHGYQRRMVRIGPLKIKYLPRMP